ncbi:MAG: helix-turn-helix transcriptional regulator [Candidatus Heimdallarchaeota archaeon]|nr:helix-turn-helix transcriptional regulator [Candidatus Heimdallarchaeota archaeon]
MDKADREILLNHWKQIPSVKYMEDEVFKFMDHPIRTALVKILRQGIQDGDDIRHVMSLKELLPEINKELQRGKNEKIPITTLYYHKDKLLEAGIIEDVHQVLQGKTMEAYYGRTGKGFIGTKQFSAEMDQVQILKNVLLAKNPELKVKEIEEIYDTFLKHGRWLDGKINQWIKENENLIEKNNLDIIEIYEMFYTINPVPLEFHMDRLKISELMGMNGEIENKLTQIKLKSS